MKKASGLILLLCIVAACGTPPGASRDPIPSAIYIYDPLYQTSDVSDNSRCISERITYSVKTFDSNNNIVNYSPNTSMVKTLSNEPRTSRNWLQTKALYQPKGATGFVAGARIVTRECGWPIPNQAYNGDKGGEIEMEAVSSIREYPHIETFYPIDFNTIWAEECK